MIRDWVQLSRPPSQLYILIPLLFGWFLAGGRGDFSLVALLVLGICFQFVTVCVNDLVDVDADTQNPSPTYFSGGSRVLVEGKLTEKEVKKSILITFLISLGLALFVHFHVFLWVVLGYVLLFFYCLKPFQMSYHGYGEWLQALGMGGVLPLIGWSFLEKWWMFHEEWLMVLLPLHYSLACVTTLPDIDGDRRVGKKSLAARVGRRKTVVYLCGAAIASWLVAFKLGFLELGECLLLLLCMIFLSSGLLKPTASFTQQVSIGFFISLVLGLHVVWVWRFFI